MWLQLLSFQMSATFSYFQILNLVVCYYFNQYTYRASLYGIEAFLKCKLVFHYDYPYEQICSKLSSISMEISSAVTLYYRGVYIVAIFHLSAGLWFVEVCLVVFCLLVGYQPYSGPAYNLINIPSMLLTVHAYRLLFIPYQTFILS